MTPAQHQMGTKLVIKLVNIMEDFVAKSLIFPLRSWWILGLHSQGGQKHDSK